jgi:hypothetical protein
MVTLLQLQNAAPQTGRWAIYQGILAPEHAALSVIAAAAPLATRAMDDVLLFRPLLEALDLITSVAMAQDLSELRTRVFDMQAQPPATRDQVVTLRDVNGHAPIADAPANPNQRTSGAAYQWYLANYIAPQFQDGTAAIAGVRLFLDRFPLTEHYLTRIAAQFCANLGEAITRVQADQNLLNLLFFGGAGIQQLDRIELSGADSHKGGKQVLFLTFRLHGPQNPTARLVYKPSDVELDYRICGDTVAVATATGQPNPLGAGASLVERINRHAAAADRLPTYRILPCNPGSQLHEDQNGALPIRTSYGYVEFLSSQPPRRADGLYEDVTDDEVAQSDWLCATVQEVRRFYYTWGQWIALARLFSWGDLHQENVIVHRKRPYPIDLEISCTGPMSSLMGTQIAVAFATGGLASGTAPHPRFERGGDNTANLQFDPYIRSTNALTVNRIAFETDDGWRVPAPERHLVFITGGMRAIYQIVTANRGEFLDWIALAGARFTPYSTGNYTRALAVMAGTPAYAGWEPPVQAEGPDADPAADHDNLLRWKEVIDPLLAPRGADGQPLPQGAWPPNRPNDVLATLQHDYRDFANHDVPAYYHRLNSPQLLNARGQTVVVPNVAPHNRPSYFPAPTLASVQAQVQQLNAREIEAQVRDAIALISPPPQPGCFSRLLNALGLRTGQGR